MKIEFGSAEAQKIAKETRILSLESDEIIELKDELEEANSELEEAGDILQEAEEEYYRCRDRVRYLEREIRTAQQELIEARSTPVAPDQPSLLKQSRKE